MTRIRLTDKNKSDIDRIASSMKKPNGSKIGRQLKLNPSTVQWYLITHGFIVRDRNKTSNRKPSVRNGITIYPYTAEHDDVIESMRLTGTTCAAIADVLFEKFGIKRTAHSVHVRSVYLAATQDVEAA